MPHVSMNNQPKPMPKRSGWLAVFAGIVAGVVGGWVATAAHGPSKGDEDYNQGLELLDTNGSAVPKTMDILPHALDVGQAWLRIVGQMPAFLFTTDADLNMTFITGGGMQELGLTPDMYVGKSIQESFRDPGTAIPPHMSALRGRSVIYEYTFGDRLFDIHVEPLRTPDDRVVGTVAIAIEITERKAMERALHDMQAKLEQRVKERTRELSESRERLEKEVEQHRQTAKQLRQSEALYEGIVNSETHLIIRLDLEGQFTFANQACCELLGKEWDELKGTPFHPFIHEEDKPAVRATVDKIRTAPNEDRNPLRFRMHTVRGVRWLSWKGHYIHAENDVSEFQAIGLDMHEQIVAEEAERRQRDLVRALGDSAASIVSTLELDEVLDRILANVGKFVEHDAANIMLLDENGIATTVGYRGYYDSPLLEAHAANARFHIEDVPLLNHMRQDLKPVLVNDTRTHPEWVEDLLAENPVRSYFGAPIIIEGKLLGFLNLDCWKPNRFDKRDVEGFQAFANHVAIAIHNARLYEEAQEAAADLAAERERQRIAQDLHDAVSQTLFTAHVMAESLPRVWANSPVQAEEHLAEIADLTRGALAEMRSLLRELRPEDLAKTPLDDLLEKLVDAFNGKSHTALTLSIHGRTPIPSDVRVALYRIAQEALNNVRKHARAHRAEIALDSRDGRVTLRVQDDGRGFEKARPGRSGLKIMRERAASIGAELHVSSELNEGTMVEVVWPIPGSGGQDDE